MDSLRVLVAVALLALLLALIVLGPIFTIWSLNILFGLHIPMTLKTWAAAIWLMTVLYGIRFQLKRG